MLTATELAVAIRDALSLVENAEHADGSYSSVSAALLVGDRAPTDGSAVVEVETYDVDTDTHLVWRVNVTRRT